MADAIKLLEKQKKTSNSLLNESTITETSITSLTITEELKKRIIDVLDGIDIYDDKKSNECIPDYKFPEVRWDNYIKSENTLELTDDEIKSKFQLLTEENQQKKRKICNQCYHTGKRGTAFDIPFFYKGNEYWNNNIPKRGKTAELGCEGCAWYDFAEWRKQLLNCL